MDHSVIFVLTQQAVALEQRLFATFQSARNVKFCGLIKNLTLIIC
jgi:hypothetical protein